MIGGGNNQLLAPFKKTEIYREFDFTRGVFSLII